MKRISEFITVILLSACTLILLNCSPKSNKLVYSGTENSSLLSNEILHFPPINSNNQNVFLLPGSSGLKIFKDRFFYHRMADSLQKLGFNVFVVDYKPYYKNNMEASEENNTPGKKIEAVLKDVILELKKNEAIKNSEPIHLIGWSLAGEGLYKLLKDSHYLRENKITSAALYYPSNRDKIKIHSKIPLLIQIGDLDNVVDIRLLYEEITNFENIEFVVLEDSHHGFDILTIDKPKNFRFPPFFGKKYTFASNPTTAKEAYTNLISFLNVQRN